MENQEIKGVGVPQAINLAMIVDDMWRGLKRFGWIFLIVISVVSSLFYLQAKRNYSPVYQAYSSFVVNTRNAYGYSETYYNKATAEQMSVTFPYIMTSSALRQVVAEELGLEYVPGEITAEAVEETALFTIKVTSGNAQMAYDVLQSVITNYPIVAEYIIGDTLLTLMDESGVPDEPINPAYFTDDALKGAIIAAALSVVLLFLYAFTRKTVRREEDLKERLSVPFLGAIPRVPFKKRRNEVKRLVLMDQKETSKVFGETFRIVRTRLVKEMKESNVKQILVTSAVEGEGKSTVAANLAISLAQKGKSVLLIDGDMRNPSLLDILGMEKPTYGIFQVIDGQATLKEALVTYGDLDLKILGGREGVVNPTKMLGSAAMKELLDGASKMADYVIVDAPPSTIVSDASLLARRVPGVLFVVRQDYVGVKRVASGVENMSETGAKILGYVINGTEMGITGYGYTYGYGYGYGKYGYGRYGYGKYGYGKYGYGKYGYGRYGYGEEKKE